MVIPAGGARLALHVLLLLAATPRLTLTSPSSMTSARSGHSSSSYEASNNDNYNNDDVNNDHAEAYVRSEHQQQQHQQQQQQQQQDEARAQADMAAMESYTEREDIQVGCRELRAKRYISDGFCTSMKPIKEVVCAGNCLPIRTLPWYAEFVKVWARSKLREWQCEEDVVRRKNVSLLCRDGNLRYYRIKVVKSCKCKRSESKHNRTDASSSSALALPAASSSSSSEDGGGRGGGRGGEEKNRKRKNKRNRKGKKEGRRSRRRKQRGRCTQI